MRWTISLDGGPQRVNHAAIAVSSRKLVFIFGGYWTGKNYSHIEKIDTHIFNTVSLKWFALKEPDCNDPEYKMIPYMRYGHTVCGIDNIAYLFGGRSDQYGASNVLHCFDTDKLKWYIPNVTGYPPAARDGHSCCVVGSRVYIFGGYEEVAECFSCEIYFLDTEKMLWQHPRPIGEKPSWRDFHTSTAVNNKIYVFGGRGDDLGPLHSNSEVYDNTIYEYDTDKNTWILPSVHGKVPSGRRSHSAITLGRDIYIFGGYNGIKMKHFSDLWKFDTVSKTWQKLKIHGNGPCARRRQSWCLVGTEAVLYGGTCPVEGNNGNFAVDDESSLEDLSDVFILDFAPTLKTLCKLAVLDYKLCPDNIPPHLRQELERMSYVAPQNQSSPGLSQG